MKLKENDIDFLGVDKDKILNSNPKINQDTLELMLWYIEERQNVMKKKESGEPFPWTSDLILQNYSFTNNHRFRDKVSKEFIKRIQHNDYDTLSDKIYKTIVSRIYNTIEFINFTNIDRKDYFDKNVVMENVSKLSDPSLKDGSIYTKAFRIIMPKHCYKKLYPTYHYRSHVLLHVYELRNKYGETIGELFKTFNAKECFEWLVQNVKGLGNFLGYQVMVDLSYINEIPFSDRRFAVAGPGCALGLKYLYEDWDGLTAEELLWHVYLNLPKWLKDKDKNLTYNNIFDNLPEEDRYFDLQECENLFCELSKMWNYKHNRQRRRRRYYC